MSERIDTTARRPFPRLSKIGNQMNYSANTDPELAIGFAGRPKAARCLASSGQSLKRPSSRTCRTTLRPVLLELRRQALRAS